MEENTCPCCGSQMFDVYFNDDPRYEKVQYKRCMNCNYLAPYCIIERKEKPEMKKAVE